MIVDLLPQAQKLKELQTEIDKFATDNTAEAKVLQEKQNAGSVTGILIMN